jgi:hypothetical protein
LFADPSAARAAVHATAREVVAEGASRFLVGGQRGVDTWAAQAALDNAIPYSLILPSSVDEFARDWDQQDRRVLEQLVAKAAVLDVAGGYSERNRMLATGADVLVAVWTRTAGGGTAETVEFARSAATVVREIVLEPSALARSARGRGI